MLHMNGHHSLPEFLKPFILYGFQVALSIMCLLEVTESTQCKRDTVSDLNI